MASLGIRFGVIRDAQRRQRRRRRLAAAVLVAATVAFVVLTVRSRQPEPSATAQETAASASAALAAPPAMGVACPTPNSIACDRVGVAVQLRRPAVSIRAELRGHSATLNDATWNPRARHRRRKGFIGFIQPAGLRDLIPPSARLRDHWTGPQTPSPEITLHIDYGHGRRVVVHTHAGLGPGWG